MTFLPLCAQNDSIAPAVKERRWDKRKHLRYDERWERLKPTHLKWQYAGGMGLNSVGVGWDYGRRCQWETDFQVGFPNALEFDYSSAVPNIQFIRDEGDHVPEGVEKTVVAMHAGPFSEQFNNNIAEYFHYYLKEMPDLQFCVYGHGHNVSVDEFFDDGIKYYECSCAKDRSYLFFTLNSNGYTYEVVNF